MSRPQKKRKRLTAARISPSVTPMRTVATAVIRHCAVQECYVTDQLIIHMIHTMRRGRLIKANPPITAVRLAIVGIAPWLFAPQPLPAGTDPIDLDSL